MESSWVESDNTTGWNNSLIICDFTHLYSKNYRYWYVMTNLVRQICIWNVYCTVYTYILYYRHNFNLMFLASIPVQHYTLPQHLLATIYRSRLDLDLEDYIIDLEDWSIAYSRSTRSSYFLLIHIWGMGKDPGLVLMRISFSCSVTFPVIFDRNFRFMEISATNERK